MHAARMAPRRTSADVRRVAPGLVWTVSTATKAANGASGSRSGVMPGMKRAAPAMVRESAVRAAHLTSAIQPPVDIGAVPAVAAPVSEVHQWRGTVKRKKHPSDKGRTPSSPTSIPLSLSIQLKKAKVTHRQQLVLNARITHHGTQHKEPLTQRRWHKVTDTPLQSVL